MIPNDKMRSFLVKKALLAMSKAFEAFVTNVGPSAAFARSFENLTSLTRLKLHPPQKEYVLVHL